MFLSSSIFKTLKKIGFIVFVALFFSCANHKIEYSDIFYEVDTTEILNPERGFYRPFGTKTSNFSALQKDVLLNLRKPNIAAGGFVVGSSLTYRSYQFDNFLEDEISTEILELIQKDFNIVREVGNKIVLRFAYSNSCCTPPFNDAPKETIFQHLDQLKPLLHKNKDIIAVVQMGLIGPWGEQFYSDHFGDLAHGPVTDKNWKDRSAIITKLLEVVPKSRMIQIRAPYYKLRYLNGKEADPAKAKALEIENAYNGSAEARLAHHNDCMLANYDDYWTYHSFKEWPAKSDTLNLKPYIAKETKFLVFGGETCPGGSNGEDVYSPINDCLKDGGTAENYLKRFHTSFLNTAWSGAVNGDWNNKCIGDIKQKLGYRFQLIKGTYPKTIINKQENKINITLINKGYAAPFNKRLVEIILKNKITDVVYKVQVNEDPRFWFTDELQTLNLNISWKETLPKGKYELYLNLPDFEKTIQERPEYSIRIASTLDGESIWDGNKGWNLLVPTIKVE